MRFSFLDGFDDCLIGPGWWIVSDADTGRCRLEVLARLVALSFSLLVRPYFPLERRKNQEKTSAVKRDGCDGGVVCCFGDAIWRRASGGADAGAE
jgi:hypothetical protein